MQAGDLFLLILLGLSVVALVVCFVVFGAIGLAIGVKVMLKKWKDV